MSLAARLSDYIGKLTVYGGDRDGEPFRVLPWEREFIRGAFPDGGTVDSYLTIGRGNGKSAVVAAIATAMVDPAGPLHGNRAQCICVASSFEQAKIIFGDVLSFMRAKYDLTDRDVWRLGDSGQAARLEHRPTGALIRCIGSDPSRAHGLRPYIVLADEPAQWPKNSADRMFAALRTSLGKIPGSRFIALGTQSENPMHFFTRGLRNERGDHYAQSHVAPESEGRAMFRVANYRAANPSWDHLPSLRAVVKKEAREAMSDPLALPSFRALRLNQGVHDTEQHFLVDPALWRECIVDVLPPAAGPMVWGVDLGSSYSQSVVAAYWPETARLEAIGAFPLIPSLEQRGINEGMGDLWVRMGKQGDLIQCGLKAIDQTALMRAAADRFGYAPVMIGSDRWKRGDLYNAVSDVGISSVMVDRGQGFKDGGEDVRNFRKLVAGGRVKCGRSLLLNESVVSARVMVDPSGNAKIDKTAPGNTQNARDDAAAASTIAVSLGAIHYPRAGRDAPESGMSYLDMAV